MTSLESCEGPNYQMRRVLLPQIVTTTPSLLLTITLTSFNMFPVLRRNVMQHVQWHDHIHGSHRVNGKIIEVWRYGDVRALLITYNTCSDESPRMSSQS